LLQALHAEDLGADRFVALRRSDHDGVSGVHFQLSFRPCLTGIHLPLILLDLQQIDDVRAYRIGARCCLMPRDAVRFFFRKATFD